MWACKHCGKQFDFKTTSEKANHSRWCNKNPRRNETKNLKEAQRKRVIANLGKMTTFEVTCEACGNTFEVREREKQFPKKDNYFCCRSCANTRGALARARKYKNRPDSELRYTEVCWRYHEKQCVVCGEDKIVAVHHYDEKHNNNDPSNLVPLCPTHHHYMHSRYRILIADVVKKYVDDFMGLW